ncbi:ABC-type nitrate/sulfonate/bicarbonate transport system substrate-binding protein [Bradyrhizobium sp. GM6.1]
MHVSIRLMPVVALAAFSVILAHATEPEKTKLKIAVGSQILNYMPVELGVKLGSFKEEGLDVTVENFQAGGSKALQALIGGSVDGTIGFYDHTIQMQVLGKQISCVFLLNDIPGVLLGVRSDLADKVRSGADLKGLRLGITAPGSSTESMARYYIKKSGLGSRDVNIIAVGSGAPGMVALEAMNVDALVYFDPIATLLARAKRTRQRCSMRARSKAQSRPSAGPIRPRVSTFSRLSSTKIPKRSSAWSTPCSKLTAGSTQRRRSSSSIRFLLVTRLTIAR